MTGPLRYVGGVDYSSEISICPSRITVRDYPRRTHPNCITVTVQCVLPPGHLDSPIERDRLHSGWIMSGVSAEWPDTLDGIEFDADNPLVNREDFL